MTKNLDRLIDPLIAALDQSAAGLASENEVTLMAVYDEIVMVRIDQAVQGGPVLHALRALRDLIFDEVRRRPKAIEDAEFRWQLDHGKDIPKA